MIENIYKKQWLCLENWVYVAIHPNQLMLYNTQTGQYIISEAKVAFTIVEKMHERKKLGVVLYENEWFNNISARQFIENAVAKNIFTYESYMSDNEKPIRLMPVLNIQKNAERLKREYDTSVGEKSLHYLIDLTLYVNNHCNLNCIHCSQSYKQFSCCFKHNNRSELNLEQLTKIASHIKFIPLERINIIGGNLFSYHLLDNLLGIFNEKKSRINLWSHYKNFQISKHDVIWNIIVDFPFDNQLFSNLYLPDIKETAIIHFIVQNEDEIILAEKTIEKFNIQNNEIHPFYNGNNDDFFNSCVFLNKEDIFENVVKQRQIFCNQALNSNFFGHLTILPNGDVFSNINTPILGNINEKTILELITEEMDKNYSWRKIRNEKPCNLCLFQYLCPPISNYEMIFNRTNLCTIYEI